jgi:hypothetical protein
MAAIWASVNAAVQDVMNCPRVLDAQLLRHWFLCQHAPEVSIVKTDTWPVAGIAGGLASAKAAVLVAIGLSASTFGGGLILGARIAIPALVVALIGWWQTPNLVSIGWLNREIPPARLVSSYVH